MNGDIDISETQTRVLAIKDKLAGVEHTGDGDCVLCGISQLAEIAMINSALGNMRYAEFALVGMETIAGMHPELWEAFGGSIQAMAEADPEVILGPYVDAAREIRYAAQLGSTDWDALAVEIATEAGVDVAEVAPAVESVKAFYGEASPDAVAGSESAEGSEASPEPVSAEGDAVADPRERFLAKLRSMLNIT